MPDKWAFVKNKNRDIFEVLDAMPEYQEGFAFWVQSAIVRSGLRKSEVIRRSMLNQTFGYQIISGHRRASRDKLVQLAFGIGLTIERTSEMLELAGKNQLCTSDQRDVAIAFCLARHYDVRQADELLEDLGQKLLLEPQRQAETD